MEKDSEKNRARTRNYIADIGRKRTKTLVPVSERGVMQRVNRRLIERYGEFKQLELSVGTCATTGEKVADLASREALPVVRLRKSRGQAEMKALGAFYLLDVLKRNVVEKNVDLE